MDFLSSTIDNKKGAVVSAFWYDIISSSVSTSSIAKNKYS